LIENRHHQKMDLRQLRYFIQAARRENFRKASDDLRVAQSALTRQIQHLEHELGFLLFDRVKRGVRLTAAAQRLLERSQHILGEADRLKEGLQIEAHVPCGPASLAAPPSIGRLLFNKLALTFLKSYPKVNLRACLRAGHRTSWVSSGVASSVLPSLPTRRPIRCSSTRYFLPNRSTLWVAPMIHA
jgi:DNA-binding transcriptional LysR family regulator